MTEKIEIGKFYTYKNNPIEMKCLERYEDGGVAVYHTVDYAKRPMISTQYLRDEDLAGGSILQINPPVRGYLLMLYNGDTDVNYIDNHVYVSRDSAQKSFERAEKNNPYLRLVEIREIKF